MKNLELVKKIHCFIKLNSFKKPIVVQFKGYFKTFIHYALRKTNYLLTTVSQLELTLSVKPLIGVSFVFEQS